MKLSSLIGHVNELYTDVIASPKPADRLIDVFFRERKYLGSKDRRFISETLYGILRNKRKIESSIHHIENKRANLFSCIAYLLLNRKYSPDSLMSELDIPAETLLEIEQNINSTLPFDSSIESTALHYSFQDWMIKEWNEYFGNAELVPLCETLNTQAPMTLRVNTIRTTVEDCQQKMLLEGVETEKALYCPYALHLKKRINVFQLQAFKDGLFEVQDEGSQLLALLVDPKPKSKVLDACAGAGGKALAMASIMNNRGEIFAFDIHSTRLEELKKRIRRSGVDSIRTKVIQENEVVEGFIGAADFVLVDAPCTGTGTIRRNPGMKWSVTQQMVKELREKQLSILTLNSQYTKVGGRLVYATCSLIKDENENVVEQFLSKEKNFELVNPSSILERYNLAGVTNNKYFQLLPHKYNTDGFFAAVMKRVS
ncbi:MAG: class I SAM-dependent methyltransferase [Bacteroidota bacterium]|nr:class I SAM-dependent methyltransferase [Bacteroidota bacterium]